MSPKNGKGTKGTGLVEVFTGDGRGKTTAALGTVLRAAGHGKKVFIVFFMKGKYPYGEFRSLAGLPGVEFAGYGLRKFVHKKGEIDPREKLEAQAALVAARKAITSGSYDLVVLDEVNIALYFNLITLEDLKKLITEKPPHVELILTGRNAPAEIVAMADLVTEMKKIKHPFDKGIGAREGIEY